MSRRVCSNCSGWATAGSYSTSACSCVRLTATLSTPGSRPSAFSIVPVHREQWRPPIRARIFRRSGLAEGSSLHGLNVVAAERLIDFSAILALGRYRGHGTSAAALGFRLAPHDPKAGPLDRVDEAIFLNGLRVVEHASLPLAERHRCHPHSGFLFDKALDGARAGIAVHAFDFEYGGFHPLLRSSRSPAAASSKSDAGQRLILGASSQVKWSRAATGVYRRQALSFFCS